ncbi:MAG: alpha/beta fold hydrolase [Bdellovibrionota bacterium]|jgi:predicted alpha/beta-fold hydrolase|nr:alpha/beta fold hydrolase [Bdellovibrionota bacterium]
MPIVETNFNAPTFMSNGHFQTLYPYFFRKVKDVELNRERIELPDGDFIDVDILDNSSDQLVILSHGLEGNSNTGYIKGMAKYLAAKDGVDIAAWNYRSCSGELNRKSHFYHAASCGDLSEVIRHMRQKKNYKSVHLIGFSLGGNLTAYYTSVFEERKLEPITSSVIFSSTLHLQSSIRKLQDSQIGNFYSESFLVTMRKKALEKQQKGLLDVDPNQLRKCKDFIEFDELITAPTNGFKNAHDYYEQASAIHVLHKVKTPTLIIQAKDDPFLTKECFPIREAYRNKNIFLEVTPSGGHVGFMVLNKKLQFWGEERASEFIKQAA